MSEATRAGACALGIDLGGTHTRVGVVDAAGRLLASARIPTRAAEGPEAVIARVAEAARGLLGAGSGAGPAAPPGSAAPPGPGRVAPRLLGAGIGTPGPVDARRGVIVTTPNLPGWREVPVAALLARALGAHGLDLPVRHERDANLVLLGEAWRGAARGRRDAVLLTLGTGIGGAVLAGGALCRGRDGYAGELGHITIDPDGPPCGCGNRGCLEAFASGTALRRRTGREGAAVFAAAAAGDAADLAAVREVGAALGIGLAALANIFNPSAIVLGGGMLAGADLFWDAMLAEMRRRAFAPVTEGLEVVRARLGDAAGILGAARLVLHPDPDTPSR